MPTAAFREALDQMNVYALSCDATKEFVGDIRKEPYP
jgi:hypothetical protein